MTPAISVEGLRMSYGELVVLEGLNCAVAQRETFAIIGPNGAGKTTFFKCLTGEAFADSGVILHNGEDITRLSPSQRVKRGIGRTFQVSRVYPQLSVVENIGVAVEARDRLKGSAGWGLFDFRMSRRVMRQATEMAADLGLQQKLETSARYLSHGDKKRLELGIVLALEPAILMMDEPTAGMSPTDRHQTILLLDRIRRERNITIMLTEHDMDVVFGLASRILVLNLGRAIALGSIEEVRSNPAVQEVYLGEELDVA